MENLTITTEKISQSDLIELLNNVSRGTFVHLVTETVVRMNKRGNPYHNLVIKRSSRNYLLGNSYEDRKNNNLEKSGELPTFVVSENKVGEHVSKVVLYNENTGKYYLQLEHFEKIKPKNEYTMNGDKIKKELFESFMVKSNSVNDVQVISVSICNIKEITLKGTKYMIE